MAVVVTDHFEGLTLAKILNTVLYELGHVTGSTENYNRFSRAFLVRKLNDRQNKFVYHSQCLKKSAILLCKTDYRTYKLPANCMDAGVVGKPKYYSSSTTYVNLEVKDTQWLDEHYEGWLTGDSSDPEFCYMAESYGNIPMLGVYPSPDADGTDYTITPDTGIVTGGDLPGATSNISGAATGNGTGTALGDTTVDFTALGLVAGMAVNNVTDGSAATISSIAANVLTTTALSGGTDDTWSAGDSYQILSGEYGVVTKWDNDDVYLFSAEVGEIANITVPAGNIQVDYVPYPLAFPESGNDNQYPEIPKLYHMDLAMGVVSDCLRTFTEGSKEFTRSKYYDDLFSRAIVQARGAKERRPFSSPEVKIAPFRRWRTR